MENQLQDQPDFSSGVEEGTVSLDPESDSNRNGDTKATFESSQLSFAGFTFSSPKLAPLSSIYLAPSQTTHEVSSFAFEETISERQSSLQAQRIHELGKNRIGLRTNTCS